MLRPHLAPPIAALARERSSRGPGHGLTWYLAVPLALIVAVTALEATRLSGPQGIVVSGLVDQGPGPELRTGVPASCQAAMIELHGQAMWDRSVAAQQVIDAAGGGTTQVERTPEQIEAERLRLIADAAPLSEALLFVLLFLAFGLSIARGVAPDAPVAPLLVGAGGILASIVADWLFVGPLTGPGATFMIQAIPFLLILYGLSHAAKLMAQNELLRVVFPPLILIVAVLGSILGGITNPTPAAGLGAAGALMLAAYRKLQDEQKSGKAILTASFALVIMLLVGVNFDLRLGLQTVTLENRVAFLVAWTAYLVAMVGVIYACYVLFAGQVLRPVVRETAKVTAMVFAILIGSQMLNLVVISFGGEHYIQEFLRSFDNEIVVFLIVMLVLFILGFVLDFLEIIYIVVPIVGPVIYGGTLDPKWVTIMIAVNLQTSFLTPPFGFALFYLRGVAPAGITTMHIYRGVIPFVLIQMLGLAILWLFPSIITIVPDLMAR
jgi:TRAP-type mannitol/chloroaromatic compound transport system permease large subunit